jgi:hypothetical protein
VILNVIFSVIFITTYTCYINIAKVHATHVLYDHQCFCTYQLNIGNNDKSGGTLWNCWFKYITFQACSKKSSRFSLLRVSYLVFSMMFRAASHYSRPSWEAVGMNGQTLLRVRWNGLKFPTKYRNWSLRAGIVWSSKMKPSSPKKDRASHFIPCSKHTLQYNSQNLVFFFFFFF